MNDINKLYQLADPEGYNDHFINWMLNNKQDFKDFFPELYNSINKVINSEDNILIAVNVIQRIPEVVLENIKNIDKISISVLKKKKFQELLDFVNGCLNKEFKDEYLEEKRKEIIEDLTASKIHIEKELNYTDSFNKVSKFKLSNKRGTKTNLIRILHAIYELRIIKTKDDQLPNKQEFMEAFGAFLGEDLKSYSSNLSQALQNQPLEINLQIFEDMKNIIQKGHFPTEKK